jgi:hypothetical protein
MFHTNLSNVRHHSAQKKAPYPIGAWRLSNHVRYLSRIYLIKRALDIED